MQRSGMGKKYQSESEKMAKCNWRQKCDPIAQEVVHMHVCFYFFKIIQGMCFCCKKKPIDLLS